MRKPTLPATEGMWRYRAMIYFGVATLHFYRDDILPLTPQQSLGDFADANKKIIDLVLAEAPGSAITRATGGDTP